MTKAIVDTKAAVIFHRDKGWRIPDIARFFGVQCPSIYRAFRKENYATPGMLENRNGRQRDHLLPPDMQAVPIQPATNRSDAYAANALPVTMLAACSRCGTRGDIGCGCKKAPVGWHTG